MFKKWFSLGAITFILALGLVLEMRAAPAVPASPAIANASAINSFMTGPALKVYLVPSASEVLWQPGSGVENNSEMIY